MKLCHSQKSLATPPAPIRRQSHHLPSMRMNWILLFTSAWLLGACVSSKQTFLLTFHIQTENQDERDSLRVALTDPPSEIRVEKFPWLTEDDVEIATVQKEGQVLLTFTSHGKEKLEKLTRENMGRIVTLVFNQRVIYAPVIDITLSDGSFIVPYGLTSEDVNYLNDVIAQKKAWSK